MASVPSSVATTFASPTLSPLLETPTTSTTFSSPSLISSNSSRSAIGEKIILKPSLLGETSTSSFIETSLAFEYAQKQNSKTNIAIIKTIISITFDFLFLSYY